MVKSNAKLTVVGALQDGDKFEIPSLKDSMRNLQVVKVGSCSAMICGEKINGYAEEGENEQWKWFSHPIALSTPAVWLGHDAVVKVADGEPKRRGRKPKAKVEGMEAAPKRGRGRPRNPNKIVKPKGGKRGRPSKGKTIVFPEGNWTIEQVAKLSGCKKHDVVNYLTKMKKAGTPIQIKEVGNVQKEGKGRAAKIYKLA